MRRTHNLTLVVFVFCKIMLSSIVRWLKKTVKNLLLCLGNTFKTRTCLYIFFLNYMRSNSPVAPHVEEDWESEYQDVMSNGLEDTPYGRSAFQLLSCCPELHRHYWISHTSAVQVQRTCLFLLWRISCKRTRWSLHWAASSQPMTTWNLFSGSAPVPPLNQTSSQTLTTEILVIDLFKFVIVPSTTVLP